jgi:hypothetical protein
VTLAGEATALCTLPVAGARPLEMMTPPTRLPNPNSSSFVRNTANWSLGYVPAPDFEFDTQTFTTNFEKSNALRYGETNPPVWTRGYSPHVFCTSSR